MISTTTLTKSITIRQKWDDPEDAQVTASGRNIKKSAGTIDCFSFNVWVFEEEVGFCLWRIYEYINEDIDNMKKVALSYSQVPKLPSRPTSRLGEPPLIPAEVLEESE